MARLDSVEMLGWIRFILNKNQPVLQYLLKNYKFTLVDPLIFCLFFTPDTSLEVDLRDFKLAFVALSSYASSLYSFALCEETRSCYTVFINESLLQLVFV